MKEVKKQITGEYWVCDECGYEGGFHVIFKKCAKANSRDFAVNLKCPSCRQVYDTGWISRMGS
jgi:hypothetical protein